MELLFKAIPLLLEWYYAFRRDLPWRGTHDFYRVWVSEIMLQQTRVEAVKGYYGRFLARFPTVESLAAADEEDVLKAWEGLGYYSRARNLHKAAKIVAAQGVPRTYEAVRALPGVGDYTAGAICSIAFDLPCPAVDGNVLRVLTRLLGDGSNVGDAKTRRAFSELLAEVYPPEAGDFCQALMELGAIVCVPNGEPLCTSCPWNTLCRAHLAGKEGEFPVRGEKKPRKIVELNVYVIRKEGKYALTKRGENGLLAGLWQFPIFGEVKDGVFGRTVAVKRAKHIFTHIEWHMTGYLVEADAFFEEYLWADAEEIHSRYALPSAFKAFMEWIL